MLFSLITFQVAPKSGSFATVPKIREYLDRVWRGIKVTKFAV